MAVELALEGVDDGRAVEDSDDGEEQEAMNLPQKMPAA